MENNHRFNRESIFTGSLLGLLGVNLATAFLTSLSLGIAYPWLLCWKERWMKEHTFISGRQLAFDGTGGQLIGNWIKWSLLTFITFGIYGLWIPIRLEQWTVKHTYLSDETRVENFTQEEKTDFGETIRQGASWLMEVIRAACCRLSRWLEKVGTSKTQITPQRPGQRPQKRLNNYCPNCGAKVVPSTKFCGHCSHPVNQIG